MNLSKRTQLIRECDRLWHLLVAHAFRHRCIMCGLPGTDPHHWCYIRSILQYRWTLENGVYMCRLCHNAAEQDPGHSRLYLKIQQSYPHLWRWKERQPPLVSRPISTWQITGILANMHITADTAGVKDV
jgi:hypothetical protein